MTIHWERRPPTKRESWVLTLVDHHAERSRDTSTKVGAIVTSADNVLVATGWNDFPRGVDDSRIERRERPLKYLWTEHAERNAIYNAGRNGVSLVGCQMYIRWFPCCDCARAIIQSGIIKLYCSEPDWKLEKWGEQFVQSAEMLLEAGVEVVFLAE